MSDQRYLVTARKYRPLLFHELVSQEHVTETLKNALRLNRLAHAYLFSGPRGVGKTTAARILAKAINCTTPPEARPDASEPCRQCSSCQDFEEGRSLHIFEIDAASNNKVDDIRDLRETVRIPPQGGNKKVYIIDEVHMLSNAAFNALLKTLEEPPPHVLFIFATTEPHKVIPTILSRCQRFDFRRIPVADIVARLRIICQEEHVASDEESLVLLARKGDGALRDALSAFDQAVSLCGTTLRYDDLIQAFRVVDTDLFFEVTRYVRERNPAGMLTLVHRVVQSGYDLQEFLVGLAEHLRNLLVARTMGDTQLIEAAESTRQRYDEVSRQFAEADLLRLLMLIDAAEESIKSSTHPRMKLEMTLLKMAALTQAVDLREMLRQIDRLETLPRENPQPPFAKVTEPPVVREVASPPPEKPKESKAPVPDVTTVAEDEPLFAPRPQAKTSDQPPHPAVSAEKVAPPFSGMMGTPALKTTPRVTTERKTGKEDQSVALAEAVVTAEEEPLALPEEEVYEPLMARLETIWTTYLQEVATQRVQIGSFLQHTRPLAVKAGVLYLGVPDGFHVQILEPHQDFLLSSLQQKDLSNISRLVFRIHGDGSTAEAHRAPDLDPRQYIQQKREENPVIRAILDQFGGEPVC